jgi:hypothetical protein
MPYHARIFDDDHNIMEDMGRVMVKTATRLNDMQVISSRNHEKGWHQI